MISSITNSLNIIIAIIFLAISGGLMFWAIRSALRDNNRITKRLKKAGKTGKARKDAGAVDDNNNWAEKIAENVTLPDTDEITKIRFNLVQAGYYGSGSVKVFYLARLAAIVIPQIILIAFWGTLYGKFGAMMMIAMALTLAAVGVFGPNYFLKWRQSRRTLQCKNGFPDMMDLMVACIEAGLGLDAALMRVSDELGRRYPALKVNLDTMNRELRAGQNRHVAMMSFAERINLEEAKALAIMLKQAEEMGSSIGKALRTFSEDMRLRRMLTAEEKAMALSAKLTVPLILFIFPTLMVMLLLPAGIRLAAGFAAS